MEYGNRNKLWDIPIMHGLGKKPKQRLMHRPDPSAPDEIVITEPGWIKDIPAEEFCATCGQHGQAHGPHSNQVQHEFVPGKAPSP